MPLPSPELLLLAAALTINAPMTAQQAREAGVQVIVNASNPAAAVAALYGGLRMSTRTRLSAAAGAGISTGKLVTRGEILGHFLLSPDKRHGTGFYFAGGVAVVRGPVDRGYLVLTAGVEQRPAAGAGWMAEIGVGGGVRLALGYRWRWRRGAVLPYTKKPRRMIPGASSMNPGLGGAGLHGFYPTNRLAVALAQLAELRSLLGAQIFVSV